MKITFSPAEGSPVTLGDDTGGAPVSGFASSEEPVIQVVQPLRAKYATALPRGNRQVRVGWTVTREHASVAAAAVHAISHGGLVPDDGVLMVYQGSPSGSATLYVDVVLSRVSLVELSGVTTVFRYEFSGSKSRTTRKV